MMLKAVLLFLAAMLLLGVLGKLRLPRPRRPGGTGGIEPAEKCAVCAAYVLGRDPEPCARADCPRR